MQAAPITTKPLTEEMRGWKARTCDNKDWEMYYSAQGICEGEAELQLMKETFQAPLPVAIRINTSAATHDAVLAQVQELSQLEESRPNKCAKLNWSVDGNAWQWNDVSRVHVRKDPALIQLKKWFVDHENVGTLTRQEAVSMIPPIVLGPQPTDLVLDMCAAPGSKTCQMIESLRHTGVVVANDVEWKRANMLAHQVQRLCSPSNVICNQDATQFPTIAAFDRVLCDVPCTGDGTIRKAADIWRRWSISDGNAIHARQLQILIRGINMLKPGGCLVYSTCSLNPIENEAVVAAALAQFKDSVELAPIDSLPDLVYRAGLSSWRVFDERSKLEVDSLEAFKAMETTGKMKDTMFPPLDETVTSQLSRSARFLPHLMNTGGFYVAKFVKKPESESIKIAKGDGTTHRELIPLDEALYETLASFYGFDKEAVNISQLYFRDSQKRHIYFVTKEAAALLATLPSSFKLVSIGVRAFADIGKWDSPCPYRMTQEGIEALKLHMASSSRVACVSREAFIEFVEKKEVKTELVSAFVGIAKGGGALRIEKSDVVIAVMVSPQVVQLYTEKLYCEYLLNILKGVHDPLAPFAASSEPVKE